MRPRVSTGRAPVRGNGQTPAMPAAASAEAAPPPSVHPFARLRARRSVRGRARRARRRARYVSVSVGVLRPSAAVGLVRVERGPREQRGDEQRGGDRAEDLLRRRDADRLEIDACGARAFVLVRRPSAETTCIARFGRRVKTVYVYTYTYLILYIIYIYIYIITHMYIILHIIYTYLIIYMYIIYSIIYSPANVNDADPPLVPAHPRCDERKCDRGRRGLPSEAYAR